MPKVHYISNMGQLLGTIDDAVEPFVGAHIQYATIKNTNMGRMVSKGGGIIKQVQVNKDGSYLCAIG